MVEMAVAEVGTDKVEEFEQGKVVRGWKVTERDRLLIGHLGTVRYLSREQVWRLVFPGRAESVVAERLVALERLKLLRRLKCRRYTGEELEVWALTLGGYRVAEDVTGPLQRIPAHDVGNAFFEHHIGLVKSTCVYLALASNASARDAGELVNLEMLRERDGQTRIRPRRRFPRNGNGSLAISCSGFTSRGR